MKTLFHLGRLFRILFVFLRYGLVELMLSSAATSRRPPYILFFWWCRKRPLAQRIRLAMEDLGPIFIKFGQALSTRRDLLPEDIADELEKLQDKVPPFPALEARAIIEDSLSGVD